MTETTVAMIQRLSTTQLPARRFGDGLGWSWCRRLRREPRSPFLVDRGADGAYRRPRVEHQHRVTRHVNADGAAGPVGLPFEHAPVGGAALDEAFVVPLVPEVFAPAIAGHILQ